MSTTADVTAWPSGSSTNQSERQAATAPRRKDAAATARELLEAARLRFARQGFDRASVREIAADVGVDQALVIRYFGSKRALFEAACFTEPALEEILDADSAEIAVRLLDWVVSLEKDGNASQFMTLLRSWDQEPAAKMLRQRIQRITKQLANSDPPVRELRAELVVALLIGIAVMRRLMEASPLKDASGLELGPHFSAATAALIGPKP
jgi:AcrR family transcriptional regulator